MFFVSSDVIYTTTTSSAKTASLGLWTCAVNISSFVQVRTNSALWLNFRCGFRLLLIQLKSSTSKTQKATSSRERNLWLTNWSKAWFTWETVLFSTETQAKEVIITSICSSSKCIFDGEACTRIMNLEYKPPHSSATRSAFSSKHQYDAKSLKADVRNIYFRHRPSGSWIWLAPTWSSWAKTGFDDELNHKHFVQPQEQFSTFVWQRNRLLKLACQNQSISSLSDAKQTLPVIRSQCILLKNSLRSEFSTKTETSMRAEKSKKRQGGTYKQRHLYNILYKGTYGKHHGYFVVYRPSQTTLTLRFHNNFWRHEFFVRRKHLLCSIWTNKCVFRLNSFDVRSLLSHECSVYGLYMKSCTNARVIAGMGCFSIKKFTENEFCRP